MAGNDQIRYSVGFDVQQNDLKQLKVTLDQLKKQLTDIISHISDYQELVDKNYAFAIKNASWESRVPLLKDKLEKLGYQI